MTIQFVYFIFLMLGAFSMKQKCVINTHKNAKLRTPLLKKDMWKSVDGFLLPQNEKKFNKINKSFSQFFTKFGNISKRIKEKLYVPKMGWIFFQHFEMQKIFAQNVDENSRHGCTVLHSAVRLNKIEIVKAMLDAGVNIDVQDFSGWTALHVAALNNRLEIGKVLVEAGADLDVKTDQNTTALQLAERFGSFTEMLRKSMKD